ncbi:hypothetical protein [Kribbella sp. NPDC049227]|uniref:hypothetical protein n=1 Tax=Kribbella sp. NPDC049227 TaxID=3364113 RepID=UPI00371C2E7B
MIDFGSAAEWAGAIFTGLGFGAAVWQLRANRRDSQHARLTDARDEDARREAMARAAGVKVSWRPPHQGPPPDDFDGVTPVDVEVLNSGPYPIDGAVLIVAADDYPMQIVYGTIFPGQHIVDTYEVRRREVVFGELTTGATLEFTDTFGNFWARSGQELVRKPAPARIC